MEQLTLFDFPPVPKRLETFVERVGSTLSIPEGIHTIPCTHGLHRFPGKFIPNIPRYILRSILPNVEGRIIFDPFCGSGTVLVEAALEGIPFIGMDVDPLSVLISTAKLQPLSEIELRILERFWKHHNYRQEHPESIPTVPNLSHWFRSNAVAELSSIKARCSELPPRLKLFSLIVFSSIIRRVSKADDQTQKTYVSHTLPKNPPVPSILFPIFLNRAIQGMREYATLLPRDPSGDVFHGDARVDISKFQFHDIVTSPPYIDSIDYIYNQMLEYFWLLPELGMNSHTDISLSRKKPMGFNIRPDVEPNSSLALSLGGRVEEFESLCSRIGQRNPKEELMVRSFFLDYSTHLEVVRRVQTEAGFYVCVVGNSYIRGITVPTADFLVSIHKAFGYCLVDKLDYEIRRHYMKFPRRSNSGKIKQDHILVFRVE